MEFNAKVTKGTGYDLATKPESKKGRISNHALEQFIGKTVKVTITEVTTENPEATVTEKVK